MTNTATYVMTARSFIAHTVSLTDPSRTVCRRVIAKFEASPLNDGSGYEIERFANPAGLPRCKRCNA